MESCSTKRKAQAANGSGVKARRHRMLKDVALLNSSIEQIAAVSWMNGLKYVKHNVAQMCDSRTKNQFEYIFLVVD